MFENGQEVRPRSYSELGGIIPTGATGKVMETKENGRVSVYFEETRGTLVLDEAELEAA